MRATRPQRRWWEGPPLLYALAAFSGLCFACASVLIGALFVGGTAGITADISFLDGGRAPVAFGAYLEKTQWSMQHVKIPFDFALYYASVLPSVWIGMSPVAIFLLPILMGVTAEAGWKVVQGHGFEVYLALRNGKDAYIEGKLDVLLDIAGAFAGSALAGLVLATILYGRPSIVYLYKRRHWTVTVAFVVIKQATWVQVWAGSIEKVFPSGFRYHGGLWAVFAIELGLKSLLWLLDAYYTGRECEAPPSDDNDRAQGGWGQNSYPRTDGTMRQTVITFYGLSMLATVVFYLSTIDLRVWGVLASVLGAAVYALLVVVIHVVTMRK